MHVRSTYRTVTVVGSFFFSHGVIEEKEKTRSRSVIVVVVVFSLFSYAGGEGRAK